MVCFSILNVALRSSGQSGVRRFVLAVDFLETLLQTQKDQEIAQADSESPTVIMDSSPLGALVSPSVKWRERRPTSSFSLAQGCCEDSVIIACSEGII